MARVQSSTPGGGVDWQFQCCDGSCRRTYQRPAPLCTHVKQGMESDDPAVAAMHLAYVATFDPFVHVRARRILGVRDATIVARESRDGSEIHNYHMEAGELPAGTSRSARRRKRRQSARARAAYAQAAEGGADAAADGVPPAVVDAHRRAAKLTAVQELRRARQALAIADLARDELKDLVPDAELSLPAFNVVTGSYDPRSLKSTLLEFKTMWYGVKHIAVPRATAVDRFERSMLGDIQRGLAARDAAWHNTEPGQEGSLRDIPDMSEYTGIVFGTMGQVSKGVRRTVRGIACLAADRDSSAIPLLKLHSTSEDHPQTHVHAWPGL
eukprot:jgi/Tetstr1/442190/TSEL_030340.t1